jgi:hypothetical protein
MKLLQQQHAGLSDCFVGRENQYLVNEQFPMKTQRMDILQD